MAGLFSRSIRKRKEWAAAVPLLYQSQSMRWRGAIQQNALPCACATQLSEPGFAAVPEQCALLTPELGTRELLAEATLDARDIAIPYPGTPGQGDDVFYFMLLSPADAGDADTNGKLDRLYSLGVHVGVVFLNQGEGSNGLTEFQLRSFLCCPCSVPFFLLLWTRF